MPRQGSGRARVAAQYPRTTRSMVVVVAMVAALLAAPSAAMAWKPYAHNYIGDQAYADAVDDGRVTVGGRTYPLKDELVKALRKSRPYFNAGVVGPDGFPDLVYGQSQIHPEQTGKWLTHILDKAWKAQDKRGAGYETEEKRGRILAFAYGFLTHAAGDMWGHTLINDFADGLFPSFEGAVTDRDEARIALRHVVAEGYAGAATPGWDRTTEIKDRALVCVPPGLPGTVCNDVSNDRTRGILFAAPHEFIYDTLVNPNVRLPVGICGDGIDDDKDGTPDDGCPGKAYTVGEPEPQRGKLLDFFLDTQADLQIEAAEFTFDAEDCTSKDRGCPKTRLTVPTIRGLKYLRVDGSRCPSTGSCTTSNADGDTSISAAYLRAWIADIQSGLKDWSRLGIALTRALFDPQARRDAQNDACDGYGEEVRAGRAVSNPSRGACEQKIGAVKTVVFKTRGFVDDHLLSMLGVPDWLVYAKKITGSAFDFLSDIVDKIVGPALNPLRNLAATIENAITGFVNTKIREATGIDPEQLANYLRNPGQWMCGGTVATLKLPGLKAITIEGLFSADEHRRLDTIMGLPAGHHTTTNACSPLQSGSKYDYDPNRFAPIKNSITQAKLLLLEGRELNNAFTDVLHDRGVIKQEAKTATYPATGNTTNIMVTQLGGPAPWLVLIDGDHAWRQDGLPTFCPNRLSCGIANQGPYATPAPRAIPPVGSTGGTGQYPLWESCVLRPAFRELFTDWENQPNLLTTNFPDLGDPASPDLADRFTPGVSVRPTDLSIPLLATIVIRPGTRFTAQASDTVFTDGAIELVWKLYRPGADPGSVPGQAVLNGGTFTLPTSATGDWILEVTATDGCGSRPRTQQVQIIL